VNENDGDYRTECNHWEKRKMKEKKKKKIKERRNTLTWVVRTSVAKQPNKWTKIIPTPTAILNVRYLNEQRVFHVDI
jgi:hypothetical protein